MTILTIVSGELVAVKHGVVVANVNNMADFYRVCSSDYAISVSSSVDFPEENTSRPAVLDLCHAISAARDAMEHRRM